MVEASRQLYRRLRREGPRAPHPLQRARQGAPSSKRAIVFNACARSFVASVFGTCHRYHHWKIRRSNDAVHAAVCGLAHGAFWARTRSVARRADSADAGLSCRRADVTAFAAVGVVGLKGSWLTAR